MEAIRHITSLSGNYYGWSWISPTKVTENYGTVVKLGALLLRAFRCRPLSAPDKRNQQGGGLRPTAILRFLPEVKASVASEEVERKDLGGTKLVLGIFRRGFGLYLLEYQDRCVQSIMGATLNRLLVTP